MDSNTDWFGLLETDGAKWESWPNLSETGMASNNKRTLGTHCLTIRIAIYATCVAKSREVTFSECGPGREKPVSGNAV